MALGAAAGAAAFFVAFIAFMAFLAFMAFMAFMAFIAFMATIAIRVGDEDKGSTFGADNYVATIAKMQGTFFTLLFTRSRRRTDTQVLRLLTLTSTLRLTSRQGVYEEELSHTRS